jgi:hypothetical protein
MLTLCILIEHRAGEWPVFARLVNANWLRLPFIRRNDTV